MIEKVQKFLPINWFHLAKRWHDTWVEQKFGLRFRRQIAVYNLQNYFFVDQRYYVSIRTDVGVGHSGGFLRVGGEGERWWRVRLKKKGDRG